MTCLASRGGGQNGQCQPALAGTSSRGILRYAEPLRTDWQLQWQRRLCRRPRGNAVQSGSVRRHGQVAVGQRAGVQRDALWHVHRGLAGHDELQPLQLRERRVSGGMPRRWRVRCRFRVRERVVRPLRGGRRCVRCWEPVRKRVMPGWWMLRHELLFGHATPARRPAGSHAVPDGTHGKLNMRNVGSGVLREGRDVCRGSLPLLGRRHRLREYLCGYQSPGERLRRPRRLHSVGLGERLSWRPGLSGRRLRDTCCGHSVRGGLGLHEQRLQCPLLRQLRRVQQCLYRGRFGEEPGVRQFGDVQPVGATH